MTDPVVGPARTQIRVKPSWLVECPHYRFHVEANRQKLKAAFKDMDCRCTHPEREAKP